jgi:hypothetical protein
LGPITDLQILKILTECYCELPIKLIDKKSGLFQGWRIHVDRPSTIMYGSAHSYNIRDKWNKTQNAALQIMNSLAHMGFDLRKADTLHPVRIKHGDDYITIYVYDHSLWMVKTMSEQNRYQGTTYVIVEPVVYMNVMYIEVQGLLDPELVKVLSGEFNLQQVVDKGNRHILFQCKIKGVMKFTFSIQKLRKIESILQNYVIKVFDFLAQFGYQYITPYGGAHVFKRVNTDFPKGPYLLADPFVLFKTRQIEIQGSESSREMVKRIGELSNKNLDVKEVIDKGTGQVIHYGLKVPGMGGAFTLSATEMRRKENVFQNFFLDIITALDKMGYIYVGQFGIDGGLLQKTHGGWDGAHYVLLDPTWMYGAHIEVQCNLPEDSIVQLAKDVGLGRVEKIADKDAFYAWGLPMEKTGGVFVTMSEMRRRESRIQHYLMKILTWLYNNYYFEPVAQIFSDDLLLRYNPARTPGSFIIIDLGFIEFATVTFEIQGEITLAEVNLLMAAFHLPEPQVLIHKDTYVGYRLVSDIRRWASSQSFHYYYSPHDMNWKALWVAVVNKLRELGWQFRFCYTKGVTPGYLFFKPAPV